MEHRLTCNYSFFLSFLHERSANAEINNKKIVDCIFKKNAHKFYIFFVCVQAKSINNT